MTIKISQVSCEKCLRRRIKFPFNATIESSFVHANSFSNDHPSSSRVNKRVHLEIIKLNKLLVCVNPLEILRVRVKLYIYIQFLTQVYD